MMPYIIGRDPSTSEIIVGDVGDNTFFLRGGVDELERIRDLVSAANCWKHDQAQRNQNDRSGKTD